MRDVSVSLPHHMLVDISLYLLWLETDSHIVMFRWQREKSQIVRPWSHIGNKRRYMVKYDLIHGFKSVPFGSSRVHDY